MASNPATTPIDERRMKVPTTQCNAAPAAGFAQFINR
jgi:hypothetical protein